MKFLKIIFFFLTIIIFSCSEYKPIRLQHNSVGEIPQPIIQPLSDGIRWVLVEPYTLQTDEGSITAPPGYITDLASTPRCIWWIFPPFGTYTGAAVIHDWLYTNELYTRKIDDDIFYDISRLGGTPVWKAYWMYLNLRWFGWVGWGP
jgi:hypothetical protein